MHVYGLPGQICFAVHAAPHHTHDIGSSWIDVPCGVNQIVYTSSALMQGKYT